MSFVLLSDKFFIKIFSFNEKLAQQLDPVLVWVAGLRKFAFFNHFRTAAPLSIYLKISKNHNIFSTKQGNRYHKRFSIAAGRNRFFKALNVHLSKNSSFKGLNKWHSFSFFGLKNSGLLVWFLATISQFLTQQIRPNMVKKN